MTPHRTQRTQGGPIARGLAAALCVLAVLVGVSPAGAQIAGTPPELQHVGVTEHLEGMLPLDTPFRDHTGKAVTLRDYVDGERPIILTFAYHTCPVLCGMVLNNLAQGLRFVDWTAGDQFEIVTISIDPDETREATNAKRTSILHEYGKIPVDSQGRWHFLTGDEASIAAVAGAAGFEYQYDERQQQWGHPSVVMVVKPDGRMARYLYGLEFSPNDLRLGLFEASEGRSITTIEQIILYCYHYDPQGGKYVLVARRVMQVGGGIVALILFGVLGLFWAREWKKARHGGKGTGGGPGNGSDEGADDRREAARVDEGRPLGATNQARVERAAG
jgi:protein SCO1